MESIKDFIGKSLLKKSVHIICECLFPLDVTGIIIDYKIKNDEVIWVLSNNGKTIEIGENHPKLKIQIL